jgi:hypothetical protein
MKQKMTTKILPIQKSKTIDYGNELVQKIWQQKSNVSENQNNRNKIIETLKSTDEEIVCIQTESLSDKDLIKQIFDLAQNLKVRFYILVNEYSQEMDALNEHCLIRYKVNNKGSFILVNPNSDKTKGIFFTGQLTEESIAVTQHISRNLDEDETEELFRHFCYQFWETAKKEVIEKGKHNEVNSKPIDIFHDINAFNGKDFVYGTLFEFSEESKRGELSGKQIIYLGQETQIPISINPSSIKDLDENAFDTLLPKNEFENQEPNFTDDAVSVNIEYKWQNIPFYLPEKATNNSLYERWKKKNEEMVKALDSILNKIQEAEKKEVNLSKAISRFFLGKKTIFGALKNEIDELKQVDFSNLIEMTLKQKISRINEISTQVQNEIGEIETENRKAKLDEEIENLNTQISEKQEELENKQKELERKEKEKEQKLDEFCQKYGIDKSKFNIEKSKWEQQAGKKNKNLNPKEAAEDEQKLNELRQTQDTVFIRKTKEEIDGINKRIKSLNSAIKSKESEKNKEIQQSSSSSLNELVGGKKLKQNNSGTSELLQITDFQNLPQLPTIGTLYQLNSQQILAIEFWEQYDQGKSEAERLKVKLCAIKN